MQMINIFVIYTFIYFQKQSVLIANFFFKKKTKKAALGETTLAQNEEVKCREELEISSPSKQNTELKRS